MFARCDESGIDGGGRWIGLGALWLPDQEGLLQYEADAMRMRAKRSFWGEFKWGKLGPKKLEAYEELLSLTLELPDLRFTAMVVDRNLITRAELDEYHGGVKDLVYLKCMRRLLQHRIKHWVGQGHKEYTLLWDKQEVRGKLSANFKKYMNVDMNARDDCKFRHLSAINSVMLHFAQAADLLTGATRYAWDGKPKGSTEANEAARKTLRAQIEEWTGEPLTNDGQWGAKKFSVWKWDPTKGSGTAASASAARALGALEDS